jgi:cell division protein FtsL
MMRINLLLLMGLVLSALYLVNLQYDSRRLYAELDRAQNQARRLATENERLQLERRTQATSMRVEKLAKSQLHMRAATPAVTAYVAYPAPVQAQASSTTTAQTFVQGRLP